MHNTKTPELRKLGGSKPRGHPQTREPAKMHTQTIIPRDVRTIRYVSLVAGTVGAMFGELSLAHQTGMPVQMAWTYPVALDAYAYVAFRTGRRRDVGVALGLMAVSQAMTHLVSAHILPMCWPIVIAVWAIILPTVIYRTHTAAKVDDVAAPVDVEPAPVVDDVAPVDVEPAPVVEPAGRRNWKRADAVAFVAERLHMSTPELARLMDRTERQVYTYRRMVATTA